MYDNRETIDEYYPSIPPQTPEPEEDKGVLTTHLNARNNPHVVTAEQVGTYTKQVIDSKIITATNLNKQALDEAVHQASVSATNAQMDANRVDNALLGVQSIANQANKAAQIAQTMRDAAITASNEAKATAEAVAGKVVEAQTAATQANNAAATAKTHADTASASASSASKSAINAQASATEAKTASANAVSEVKTELQGIATQASTSASDASKSETNAKTSASQAQGYAEQAQGAVVNTLKRQEYADGAIYSTIFTQLASVVTLDKAKIKALTGAKNPDANTALLAYKDRYLMITTSGWICLNGDTLNVISAGKWGEKTYTLYTLSTHWNIAFNGERIAVFYRFNENTPNNRHAEVFDANTGEQLVDKTFTDAEMEVITSAPNKVTMSCFTKDGYIVYWGSVFDQELTHKGYVQAVDGLPTKISASPAYCCYVDNANYDAPIMFTTQACSVWLDDRYTLDENGKPILTFRGFDPDGNGMGGDRRVQFSQSCGYHGDRYNRAVCSQHNSNVSIYDVTIDPSTENKFVFTNKTALTGVKIEQVIPTNNHATSAYTNPTFYVKKNIEIYIVNNKTLGDAPVAILEGENNTNYQSNIPLCPSVCFTSNRLRPIPLRYPFYDGEALLWTRQIK